MIDIVLTSVPYTVIETPPLALGVLKGAVEAEGMSCRTIDLGMELFLHVDKQREKFEEVQAYFYDPSTIKNQEYVKLAHDFIDQWAQQLVDLNPRWYGISVFSVFSQAATYMLANKIKQLKPDAQIVVGGNGASIDIMSGGDELMSVTSLEKMLHFSEFGKRRKLFNYVIQGDGEQPLIDLLKEDRIDDSEFYYSKYNTQEYPFSNFDDFKLEHYPGQQGRIQLPVFSSKGCVRNCDFCDVNYVQGFKYRFRTGKNIVSEMIYLAERYKIREFLFLDSLANGSLKHLKEMATALAEYNLANPDKKITWSASGWISRPAGQIKPEVYELLERSGLDAVSIGVESGSDRLLEIMDKKTDSSGIYWDAEHFSRHNIKFIALMIVGHWAETWDDFLETCAMFYRLAKYARSGTLMAASIGSTFLVETKVPAWRERDAKSGLLMETRNIWWTPNNPGLTFKERYMRLTLLDRLLRELKIPLTTEETLRMAYYTIEENLEIARKWYPEVMKDCDEFVNHSEYYDNHWGDFKQLVIDRAGIEFAPLSIELEIESSGIEGTPSPGLSIVYNQQELYRNTFADGIHNISITDLAQLSTNKLEFKFFNKEVTDTRIDSNNVVIKDKYIKFNKLVIDGVNLTNDPDFFHNINYTEGDVKHPYAKQGFWIKDAAMTMDFDRPFVLDYNSKSQRYSKFDSYIILQWAKPGAITRKVDPAHYRQKIMEVLKTLPT